MNNSVEPFLNAELKQYDLLPLRRAKILQGIKIFTFIIKIVRVFHLNYYMLS